MRASRWSWCVPTVSRERLEVRCAFEASCMVQVSSWILPFFVASRHSSAAQPVAPEKLRLATACTLRLDARARPRRRELRYFVHCSSVLWVELESVNGQAVNGQRSTRVGDLPGDEIFRNQTGSRD